MNGAEQIAAERLRQLDDLGYDGDHDSLYTSGQLAAAATCYALLFGWGLASGEKPTDVTIPPAAWPWSIDEWKPSDDHVHNLVRAGALIAAEIDRMLPEASEPTHVIDAEGVWADVERIYLQPPEEQDAIRERIKRELGLR